MTLLLRDRQLLDAFRRGDAWAIRRVYDAYVDQVAGLLRKGFSFMSAGQTIRFRGYHGSWDLECAVQDTFSHAFTAAARQAYDGVSPFGPYLMTIARNQTISRLRSDFREMRRRTALEADPAPPRPQTPEQQAMRSEVRALVRQFKQSLSRDERTFLELRYVDELNLMQTARTMGLSRMKARTLEKKLHAAFVRYLRQRGVLSPGGRIPPVLVLTLRLAA